MIIISRPKQLTNANSHINIKIENNSIKRVANAMSLGVTVDERLSWDKHIDEKFKNISATVGVLNRDHGAGGHVPPNIFKIIKS